IVTHVRAMLELKRQGAVTFDYGNNIRTQAADAGLEQAFAIPGFVPEYIRPLFCEGKGPFRWVALSGEARDLQRTDRLALELFPENDHLRRWIGLARAHVALQGLPARICWLGQGERARFGCGLNDLVRRGELGAPIVIGRDQLDTGSVASPFRETEGMRDGSDAIADWPILNALLNTASGAAWVSFHHGGGTGIGNSLHPGQLTAADGTPAAGRRRERRHTPHPALGIARPPRPRRPPALGRAPRPRPPLAARAATRRPRAARSGRRLQGDRRAGRRHAPVGRRCPRAPPGRARHAHAGAGSGPPGPRQHHDRGEVRLRPRARG